MPDLLGGSAVGLDLWVGVMGPDANHEDNVERIPPHGGLQAEGEAIM